MIFTNRPISFEPCLRIGPDEISLKRVVKYLGLQIDDGLSFGNHLEHLKKKLSRLSGASFRLKSYFNYSASKNFYYACVYSVVSYCIAAYGGGITSYRGRKLAKAHERIVNNLFLKYDFSTCPFKKNKLLKLPDIHRLQAGIHMFKVENLGTNESVAETLPLEAASHDHYTRNRSNLRTPFPRVEAIRQNYQYQFGTVWNNLPDHLMEGQNLKLFKRNIIDYFIEPY